MENESEKIWKGLYSTLTTSQIEKALRYAGASWEEWRLFVESMNSGIEPLAQKTENK